MAVHVTGQGVEQEASNCVWIILTWTSVWVPLTDILDNCSLDYEFTLISSG